MDGQVHSSKCDSKIENKVKQTNKTNKTKIEQSPFGHRSSTMLGSLKCVGGLFPKLCLTLYEDLNLRSYGGLYFESLHSVPLKTTLS